MGAALIVAGGVAGIIATVSKSEPFIRSNNVRDAAEVFESRRGRSVINGLADIVFDAQKSSALQYGFNCTELPDIRLESQNGGNIWFYSGKLFFPTVPKRTGDIQLKVARDFTNVRLPLQFKQIQFKSQIRTDGYQQASNIAKANITNSIIVVQITKKAGEERPQVTDLIVIEPGDFHFDSESKNAIVIRNNPHIEWQLQTEIIRALENSKLYS